MNRQENTLFPQLNTPQYCTNLDQYQRLPSIEVAVGHVLLGQNHPIRIQSMTTQDTLDTHGTVAEAIRMIEAGCELVRITAPSKKEAENLAQIKKELRMRGYETPLVADIHYTPNAAEIAARIVEKVRINPGNYIDKKKFETIEYTEAEYQAELDKIFKRFSPLVKICKENGTAMRIGVNHGSLSDRIMSRYGDTPAGMVESALEFIQIAEHWNYYAMVVSMKASNPQVMVQAYRLLAHKMLERNKVYPIHIGVTEAGDGEDGRTKSALGIAALLADGIGDTVRVSLTEAPEAEIPPARYMVAFTTKQNSTLTKNIAQTTENECAISFNPFEFNRRKTQAVFNFGGNNVPRVIADLSFGINSEQDLQALGHIFDPIADKWNTQETGCDYVYLKNQSPPFMLPIGIKSIVDFAFWQQSKDTNTIPYFGSLQEYYNQQDSQTGIVQLALTDTENLHQVPETCVLCFTMQNASDLYLLRKIACTLLQKKQNNPIIIRAKIEILDQEPLESFENKYMLSAACLLSQSVIDGLVDGIWFEQIGKAQAGLLNRAAFNILQAGRLRVTKTEYISCPSCGRTLFDLQETTALIRKRTEHLKGVKIAIMGCIVNGPGEMADADYGYVGAGIGIISLYKGKEMVEKAVRTEEAVDKLISLIQKDGRWKEQ